MADDSDILKKCFYIRRTSRTGVEATVRIPVSPSDEAISMIHTAG